MQSKQQQHSYLCFYRDSVYKCTSDTYNFTHTKVSSDGWKYIRDVCVVSPKEALIVYNDRIYTFDLLKYKTNAFGKSNWSNCVGAISYKGNAVCIGRDWGTGELSAKNGWKYTQKQNTTWREAKMMVKIGGMGYALGHNYICQIDLETG